MYPLLVQLVVDLLNDARDKYPCEVDNDGEITYANGNDGTLFDWKVNEMLCEFGWGVPDGSVWAFKCSVSKNGDVDIYCYPNGESRPVDIIKYHNFFTEKETEELCDIMYWSTDAQGLHNVTLNKIEWLYTED